MTPTKPAKSRECVHVCMHVCLSWFKARISDFNSFQGHKCIFDKASIVLLVMPEQQCKCKRLQGHVMKLPFLVSYLGTHPNTIKKRNAGRHFNCGCYFENINAWLSL